MVMLSKKGRRSLLIQLGKQYQIRGEQNGLNFPVSEW